MRRHGMACRFPGALDGVSSGENLASGTPNQSPRFPIAIARLPGSNPPPDAPRNTPAAPLLEGYYRSMPGSFGYSPREAALLDPQQAESSWSGAFTAPAHAGTAPALSRCDRAGYARRLDSNTYRGCTRRGAHAAAQLRARAHRETTMSFSPDPFPGLVPARPERGPASCVQTACSTVASWRCTCVSEPAERGMLHGTGGGLFGQGANTNAGYRLNRMAIFPTDGALPFVRPCAGEWARCSAAGGRRRAKLNRGRARRRRKKSRARVDQRLRRSHYGPQGDYTAPIVAGQARRSPSAGGPHSGRGR